MNSDDFEYLSQFLRRRSGLELAPYRAHLVEGRLAPVARRFGFRNVESLLCELRYARETLARAVTEAMTTNESCFFRDKPVFDHFRDVVLPELVRDRAGRKHLRIWSAACAAGQEAYSLAMILDSAKLTDQGWSIDLIATDLNSDLIVRAEEGVYTEFEVSRGLSARYLATHFRRHGSSWRVCDRLKRMVSFRSFNLLDSYGWLHELDAVFCRNVLIFLEPKAKRQVIEKISEVLAPEGVLFLGHAEHIDGLDDYFERWDGTTGCYVLREQNKVIRYQKKLARIA